jgi:hypothetical protein
MTLARLPISGVEVKVRLPDGTDDVLLAEARALDIELAQALVRRVTDATGADPVSWDELPHTDLDALLLLLRRAVFGDLVRATVRCAVEGCHAPVSVAFSTAGYLEHHRRRPAAGVVPDGEPGWLRLAGTTVRFRPPLVGDVAAAAREAQPERALMARCVDPDRLDAAVRRRVERALDRLAPSLVDDLTGDCPECGATISMRFDPLRYCLRELADQARSVFEDVHLIASVYHWREAEILALPRHRRAYYAEMARQERVSA